MLVDRFLVPFESFNHSADGRDGVRHLVWGYKMLVNMV